MLALERVDLLREGLVGLLSLMSSFKACREGSPEDLLNHSGSACCLSLGCLEWPCVHVKRPMACECLCSGFRDDGAVKHS